MAWKGIDQKDEKVVSSLKKGLVARRVTAGGRRGWLYTNRVLREVLTELLAKGEGNRGFTKRRTLTCSAEMGVFFSVFPVAPSSNGKSAESGVLLPSPCRGCFRQLG